jgi:hypothetical protein
VGAIDQREPVVAYGSNNNLYEVVWQELRPTNWDIYRGMVSPNGVPGAPLALSAAPNAQSRPAIAYDPNAPEANQFLTVWHDERAGNLDVFGQRTTGLGALIGANMAINATPASERNPAIAYGAATNTYLVAWEKDGQDIQGRAYVAP